MSARGKYPPRPRVPDAVATPSHQEPAAVAQRAAISMDDSVYRGAPPVLGPIGVASADSPSVVVHPLGTLSDPPPIEDPLAEIGVQRYLNAMRTNKTGGVSEAQSEMIESVRLAQLEADRLYRARAQEQREAEPLAARKPVRFSDHAKSKRIDDMAHDELRVYAREIGVLQRDCDGLTLDRLRQNVRATLYHNTEMILEG